MLIYNSILLQLLVRMLIYNSILVQLLVQIKVKSYIMNGHAMLENIWSVWQLLKKLLGLISNQDKIL